MKKRLPNGKYKRTNPRPGSWNLNDARTGFVINSDDAVMQWDGSWVHPKFFRIRQPNDYTPTIPDDYSVGPSANIMGIGNLKTYFCVRRDVNGNIVGVFQSTDLSICEVATSSQVAGYSPVLNPQTFTVEEDNISDWQLIGHVAATDPQGAALSYSILTGFGGNPINYDGDETFYIDPVTANLYFFNSGQFTSPSELLIQASNAGSGYSSINATAVITVMYGVMPTGADKTVSIEDDDVYVFAASDFGFSDATPGAFLANVIIESLPVYGDLKLSGVAITTVPTSITVSDINTSQLTYVPDVGVASAPFTFKVENNSNVSSLTANTFLFTVGHAAIPPTGTDGSITFNQDTTYTFSAADFGFVAGVSGATLMIVRVDTLPAAGKIKLSGSDVSAAQTITVIDINAGILTFVPDGTHEHGTPYATFTFTVKDNYNVYALASNTLTVNVSELAPPSGTNHTISTAFDTTYTFAASDFGYVGGFVGSTFTNVRIDTLATNGTLELSGTPVTLSQVISVSNINSSLLTFVPDTGEYGSPYATFTFSVQDQLGQYSVSSNTMTENVLSYDINGTLASLGTLDFILDPAINVSTSGSNVTSWLNTTSTYTFSQGTTAQQPALSSSAFGTKDGIHFDVPASANRKGLVSTGAPSTWKKLYDNGTYSFVAVVKFVDVSFVGRTGSTILASTLASGISVLPGITFGKKAAGASTAGLGNDVNGATSKIVASATSSVVHDVNYVVMFVYNASTNSSSVYINGSLSSGSVSGTVPTSGGTAVDTLIIGNITDGAGGPSTNGTSAMNGYIGHIISYTGDVSANASAIHSALNTYYGGIF